MNIEVAVVCDRHLLWLLHLPIMILRALPKLKPAKF